MKKLYMILFLVNILSLPSQKICAQSSASIRATSDLNCNWRLDGKSVGWLRAGHSTVVAASTGEHLVDARSATASPHSAPWSR
jgi:hypothetical protein